MDELIRARAEHAAGVVEWKFEANSPAALFTPPDLHKVYDSIDDYLIDKPGYRVTVTVERDPGLDTTIPTPMLATGTAGV